MTLRFIIFLGCMFALSVVSYAQPVSATSYETMIETAETSAANYDYQNAIEWFDKAYKESKDPYLQIAISDLYMLLRDYPKAEGALIRNLRLR